MEKFFLNYNPFVARIIFRKCIISMNPHSWLVHTSLCHDLCHNFLTRQGSYTDILVLIGALILIWPERRINLWFIGIVISRSVGRSAIIS